MEYSKPIVSIVGLSKTGKTTFIESLLKALVSKGLIVGAIKHTYHDFEIDNGKKDSHRLKISGAKTVVLSSPKKIALIEDLEREIPLKDIVSQFMKDVDIIVTEGYKKENTKKIEIFDPKRIKEPLFKGDKNLLIIICDEQVDVPVPVFKKNEVFKVADFLISKLIQKTAF